MKNNDSALQFASDELKKDRYVVYAAVDQDGLALQFASDGPRGDKYIVLAAMTQNAAAF